MSKSVHGPPPRRPKPRLVATTKPHTVPEQTIRERTTVIVVESTVETGLGGTPDKYSPPPPPPPSTDPNDAHAPVQSNHPHQPPPNPSNSYETTQDLPLLHIICICCLVISTISLVILTVLLLVRFIIRLGTDRRKRMAEELERLPEIVPVPSVYFAATGWKGDGRPPSYQPSQASSYIYIPRDAHIVKST